MRCRCRRKRAADPGHGARRGQGRDWCLGGGWGRGQWILENDVEAVDLDMYFVVDSEEFGSVTQMELKEVRRPAANTAKWGSVGGEESGGRGSGRVGWWWMGPG
jgi:hypothetical protein